jgi:5-methylcytosine-specific restriction enzyme A
MPRRVPSHTPALRPHIIRTPDRLADNRFYASTRWRKLRLTFLDTYPLCDECLKVGRTEPAIDVHHVLDRRRYPGLAFEWSNLQSLCKSCHNAKRSI